LDGERHAAQIDSNASRSKVDLLTVKRIIHPVGDWLQYEAGIQPIRDSICDEALGSISTQERHLGAAGDE